MKRTLAVLILCIVVFTSVFACAENEKFTLRNGIHFLDSIEKVVELETIPLEKYHWDSEVYGGSCYHGTGKIVNVDNSNVDFYFDKEGKLKEMRYNLLAGIKNGPLGFAKYDDARSVYDTILETLTGKYGDPLQFDAGKVSIYAAGETRKTATQDGIITNKPKETTEWLVDEGDYCVKIELYLCASEDVFNRTNTYRVFVGYAYISQDKMDELYQQHVDQTNQEKENLNNDL